MISGEKTVSRPIQRQGVPGASSCIAPKVPLCVFRPMTASARKMGREIKRVDTKYTMMKAEPPPCPTI